jgi:signal transduction histidine kinase
MNQEHQSKPSETIVAELKERVENLERKNEMLSKHDERKDEFIGNVSHELRTAIAPVRNVISNALAGVNGELDTKFRHSLTMADNSIKRLSIIITDLLDVTRLESGRISLHRTLSDPVGLLSDAMATFAGDAARTGITIADEIHIPPIKIFMDSNRINQVLGNLIGNAIKFTPWGGNISCQLLLQSSEGKNLTGSQLKTIPEDSSLAFRISDTGCGIPEKMMEEIFKRTGQAKATSRDGATGLGLGLYISRQLVELHGGTIEVSSKQDEGSTFTFTIPILGNDEIFTLSLIDRLGLSAIHQYATSLILINLSTEATNDKNVDRADEIIRGVLRRKSDVVIQRGGGRFGLILPQTDAEDSSAVINRLYDAFETSGDIIPAGGSENDISISSATFPDDGNSAEDLIAIAEKTV